MSRSLTSYILRPCFTFKHKLFTRYIYNMMNKNSIRKFLISGHEITEFNMEKGVFNSVGNFTWSTCCALHGFFGLF